MSLSVTFCVLTKELWRRRKKRSKIKWKRMVKKITGRIKWGWSVSERRGRRNKRGSGSDSSAYLLSYLLTYLLFGISKVWMFLNVLLFLLNHSRVSFLCSLYLPDLSQTTGGFTVSLSKNISKAFISLSFFHFSLSSLNFFFCYFLLTLTLVQTLRQAFVVKKGSIVAKGKTSTCQWEEDEDATRIEGTNSGTKHFFPSCFDLKREKQKKNAFLAFPVFSSDDVSNLVVVVVGGASLFAPFDGLEQPQTTVRK